MSSGKINSQYCALGVYREWFAAHRSDAGSAPEFTDPLVVSRADLADTTWLTTNFWMGSTGSTVTATLDGGEAVEVPGSVLHGFVCDRRPKQSRPPTLAGMFTRL